MTETRHVIVVGVERGLILQALLSIHAAGPARCIVVCPSAARLVRHSRLTARLIELDLEGAADDRFIACVNELAAAQPDSVLLGVDCQSARLIDRVRAQLHVALAPTPTHAMLDQLERKSDFFAFCQRHGLRTPDSLPFADKTALDPAAVGRRLGFPFIVKPVDLAGSMGVVRVDDSASYRERILDNAAYCYRPLIAQRYVAGIDVGLNLFATGGKVRAIAMQQRHLPQHETAKISFFHNEELVEAAHVVARASKYDGVMNIDARIDKTRGEVFLIECNPRLWRSVLASTWCGLNFVAALVTPAESGELLELLSSGVADTFWHPLFRPALWFEALALGGHRTRLARLMTSDVCLLGSSILYYLHRGPAVPNVNTQPAVPTRVRKFGVPHWH